MNEKTIIARIRRVTVRPTITRDGWRVLYDTGRVPLSYKVEVITDDTVRRIITLHTPAGWWDEEGGAQLVELGPINGTPALYPFTEAEEAAWIDGGYRFRAKPEINDDGVTAIDIDGTEVCPAMCEAVVGWEPGWEVHIPSSSIRPDKGRTRTIKHPGGIEETLPECRAVGFSPEWFVRQTTIHGAKPCAVRYCAGGRR